MATGPMIDGEYTVESAIRKISGVSGTYGDRATGPTAQVTGGLPVDRFKTVLPDDLANCATGPVIGYYSAEESAFIKEW